MKKSENLNIYFAYFKGARMRRILGCFIFLMMMITSQIFAGSIYYLDATNGNDVNDGLSEETAWRTIGHVNYNWWKFQLGDDLLFKRGETFTDSSLFIEKGGTESNPLIIGAYGTGPKPIIDCAPNNIGGGVLCFEPNLSYITIQDLVIKNADGGQSIAFDADNISHITISRVEIDGNADRNGILLYKIDTYLIEDCIIINCGNNGIGIFGSASYPITNGIIRNNTIYNVGSNDGITLHEDGDGNDIGSNHQVLNNVIFNCEEEGIDITSGSYIEMRGNETFNNRLGGIVLGHDVSNVWIDQHYSHDERRIGIQIENASNVKLTSSIIYNSAYHSLTMGDSSEDGRPCTDLEVYNNTIVHGNTASIIDFYSGVQDVKFKNNIIISTLYDGPGRFVRYLSGRTPQNTNSDFSHNVWWRPDGDDNGRWYDPEQGNYDFNFWKSYYNQGEGSSFINPQLINTQTADLHLQPFSSCIDMGIDLGLDRDFEGNTIPQGLAPDIGAYEYVGVNPPLEVNINASPTSGWVPLTVNFTGSATGGVLPYSYSWDFGDSTSSSEQNPTHTYSDAGDYTVTFTVTDSQSNQDSDSLIINVSAPAASLEASFIASPASGEVPLTVNFTVSATGGVLPYSYSWDFGDGTSSSEQNPSHTYSEAGDYTVTLTVTDSESNQDQDSLIISASTPTNSAYLSCSPTSLYFGANTSGNETADQYLRIINAGGGSLTWNIEDDVDWLSCSPSSGTDRGEIIVSVNVSGLPQGLYMATIIVSSPEAYNSPQYVSVNLRVYESGQESSPFGSFDTLVDGSTVSGSVPVTGWALDDIEATRVEIKRNSDPEDPPEAIGSDGLVYLGDAVFVEGARPDVENSYPDYPLNSRAGWGYMLLTNSLPNRGNGFFTIYAFAYDASGNRVEIARKNIFCDNTNSVKPFGTLDTPGQGESIGGSDYINFGWALTPLPKTIPKDGSTICVWVDGVQMGEPVYNQYWEDIATLYPEYNNAQGSVGYYYLDTTQYENGVHTISWSVMDDGGEVDGIGARYFSIDNIETGNAHPGPFVFKRVYQEDVEGRLRIGIKEVRRGYKLRVDNEREINKKGILETQPEEMNTRRRYRLRADDRRDINIEDILNIQIEEMEPIRIVFEGSSEGNMKYIGWGENKANVLPIGSTLDREKGIFSWIPTPGFIGRYVLHFAVTDGSYVSEPLRVIVNVILKSYD